MKIHTLLLIIIGLAFSFLTFNGYSQSVNATAISPQGVVFPQLSTTEINNLSGQAKGTTVFDKDLNVMKYWNGSAWIPMQNGAGGTGWASSGNDIYNSNNGNVGVGIATPQSKLHINGNTLIQGTSFLEFGAGITKEINAGKIGYGIFTPGALDIVGAGQAIFSRKIKFWNEEGAIFMGEITTPTTGDGISLLPLAYAFIQGTGSKSSGTSNVSSEWNASCSCYKITCTQGISGSVVSVTPNSSSPITATLVFGDTNQFWVYLFDSNGNKIQNGFHIIAFKP